MDVVSADQDYEFDEQVERRASEFHAQQQSAAATMRSHRFAEVETLAKRLYGGVEYERFDPTALANRGEWVRAPAYQPRTIDAERAFDLAESFLAERDRRKAAL